MLESHASNVHDRIKEFNAIGRVRHWPVAHPQDARSTLSHYVFVHMGLTDMCVARIAGCVSDPSKVKHF